MKLFVYVKEGPQKGNYGIVEHYDGNNLIIVKLFINMKDEYLALTGWESVKMAHCNILGYFPVNNNYKEFLQYINTLPSCEG